MIRDKKLILVIFVVIVIVNTVFTFTCFAADDNDKPFADYDDSHGAYSVVYNQAVLLKDLTSEAYDYATDKGRYNSEVLTDSDKRDLFNNRLEQMGKDYTDSQSQAIINDIKVLGLNTALSPYELLQNVVTNVRERLSSGGGTVETFPVGGASFTLRGGGYLEFYDYPRGFPQEGIYNLGYRIYYPDGSLYLDSYISNYCDPKNHFPAYFNLDLVYDPDYDGSYSRTHCKYIAYFSYYDPYPNVKHSNPTFDYILVPWGLSDDDPVNPITSTTDITTLTPDEFYKYVDKLIDNLNQSYPDMSTVEGLLQSILNKLDKLDTGGCDCSDVLAELSAAIISLANSNNADNAQIITLLQSIKDNVKDGGTSTDLDPMLKKLDKIIETLDYLKLINTIDLIADGWDKLTDTEKSYLNEYSNLIVTIGNKFGLVPLNYVINYLNSAFLFTASPPQDLTFTYNGQNYVILSSSFFGKLQSPLKIARTFVSVLIIVSWAYSMRRKIIGGI